MNHPIITIFTNHHTILKFKHLYSAEKLEFLNEYQSIKRIRLNSFLMHSGHFDFELYILLTAYVRILNQGAGKRPGQ